MPKFCPECDIPLQFENIAVCPNCGVRLQPILVPEVIRQPNFAAILSFFFVGWGQWYNGKTGDGLKFFLAFLGSCVAMVIFTRMDSTQPMTTRFILIFLVAVIIGIWVYGIYDAYKTAGNINRNKDSFTKKSPLFWVPVVVLVLGIAVFIGVFFFGLGESFQPAKVVTASAIRQGDNIIIAYQGGSGHPLVSKLKYGLEVADHDWNSPRVGERVTLYGDSPGTNHVIVSVVFADNSERVILDTYL